MSPDPSLLIPLSYTAAAICYLLLALMARRRMAHPPGDAIMRETAIACVVSVLWAVSGAASVFRGGALPAIAHEYFDIFRYGTWFVALIAIIGTPGRTTDSMRLPLKTSLKVVAGLLLVLGIAITTVRSFSTQAGGPLLQLHLYTGLALAGLGLVLLEQVFRASPEDIRWNLKPLGIALGAIFSYDIYLKSHALLFLGADANAIAVRGLAHTIVFPLLALFVLRARTRPLKVQLSQSAVLHTTSLAVLGLYLVATAAIGYYIRFWGGTWGEALRLAVLFLGAVLVAVIGLSGTARARLKVFVSKHFFRYRYDYREEWIKFTRLLAGEENRNTIGQKIVCALADMVESPAGSLWTRDDHAGCFAMTSRWNVPHVDVKEPMDSTLSKYLRESEWVLDLAEFRLRPAKYGTVSIPRWLHDFPDAWLVIPLKSGQELIAFVVLSTSRVPIEVDWEVNDLLKSASLHAAAFLAQFHAAEALIEARKFEAFNKMSAFVVHDLKNIIAQLSLLLRNAERHKDNADFQRDMLETIRHSVERMRQLMLQLREGAKPPDGRRPVDLGALVSTVQASKNGQVPSIRVTVHHRVATRGDPERVERVIGHLVQNALDATPSDGEVWIDVRRNGSFAEVEVGDTGKGMTKEFIANQLFKPFSTTKTAGMGIGTYESLHYIRELGGRIDVESEVARGTRFLVALPLLEMDHASALNDREQK